MRTALALVALSTALVACRSQTALGPPPTSPGDAGPGSSSRGSSSIQCSMPVGTPWEDAAEWSGHVLNSVFWPSGDSSVRLVLPTDTRDGWVVFGGSPRLSEPTSEDLCYPGCDFIESPDSEPPRWHEGVKYPLHLEADRDTGIRDPDGFVATIPLHEPWRDWCRMQTPVPLAFGKYSCAAVDSNGPACQPDDGGVFAPGPCCHARLCQTLKVCECTSQGCDASRETADLMIFPNDDLAWVARDDGSAPIRLERLGSSVPTAPDRDAGMEPWPPPAAFDASTPPDANQDAGQDASITLM